MARLTWIFLHVAIFPLLFASALTAQDAFPNLIGEWHGNWSGNMNHPVTVSVEEQSGAEFSGTVTLITEKWGAREIDMEGIISSEDGILVVELEFWMGKSGSRHKDVFKFTTVEPNRLEGVGKGKRHVGPVSLTGP